MNSNWNIYIYIYINIHTIYIICDIFHATITSLQSGVWENNYFDIKLWDMISHPCPNYNNGGIAKLRLDWGQELVLASRTKPCGTLIRRPFYALSLLVKICPCEINVKEWNKLPPKYLQMFKTTQHVTSLFIWKCYSCVIHLVITMSNNNTKIMPQKSCLLTTLITLNIVIAFVQTILELWQSLRKIFEFRFPGCVRTLNIKPLVQISAFCSSWLSNHRLSILILTTSCSGTDSI